MTTSDEQWAPARAAVLGDPNVTYLNTGSYGLTPRVVFERVQALREELARNPVDFLWRRRAPELLWRARERLAAFLRAEPERLIFTTNVSVSINIIAASLRLAAPGEVFVTDHEYGALRFAWAHACQSQGLTFRTVALPEQPAGPEELSAAVTTAFRPETRLLFISHVFYTTGTIVPLREICAEARRRGVVTVIDGAHAPGMIPLDLAELGCDFYGANLHKWFCAPVGVGFLYATQTYEDRLRPLNVSWGWHYDRTKADERDEFGGTRRQRSFEFEGSRDITPWLVVPEAIEVIEKLGFERIRERHRELSEHVRRRLAGLPGLRQVTADHPEMRGGLTAFRLGNFDLLRLRKILMQDHRIEVNIVEGYAGNFLRVSTHYYNSLADVDRLADVLPATLAATARTEASPPSASRQGLPQPGFL